MSPRILKHVLALALAMPVGMVLAEGASPPTPDAGTLVRQAIDYWRDTSSFAVIEMTIHRPDWERRSTMRSWTRGEKDALVRFVEPAKDAGSATLKVGDDMWIGAMIGSGGGDSGLTRADGVLWVGHYQDRKIHQVDPETGAILRTIESNAAFYRCIVRRSVSLRRISPGPETTDLAAGTHWALRRTLCGKRG